jgi:hypothetical protein
MLEKEGQVQNLLQRLLRSVRFSSVSEVGRTRSIAEIGQEVHTACPAALPLAQAH